MSKFVSPEYLLKGAVYNLEQAGLLLRDASLLYKHGRYPNAVVLTIFAWEAVGKWRLLLCLRREVVEGRKNATVADVTRLCDDHETNLKAGNLSTTTRADKDTVVGKLMMSRFAAQPGSVEWNEASEQLDDVTHRQAKRAPDDRHRQRLSAQYVDPVSVTSWRRPVVVSTQAVADRYLNDARNDYSLQYDRYANPEVHREDDPELYGALEAWTDRPKLFSLSELLRETGMA
jgi:AbiV family abortive infection protein